MKISFDLDDILASFQAGWIKYHSKHYGMKLNIEDFTEFDYTKVMDITMDEVFPRIFEFYRSEDFKELAPVDGSQEVVEVLAKNHDLCILTSRTSEIHGLTEDWIQKYFGNSFDEILFSNQIKETGFEEKVTKGDICQVNNIDLHIEDAPIYVQDVLEVDQVDVVLIEKPWNRNFQSKHKQLHRLDDITKLVNLVGELDEKE